MKTETVKGFKDYSLEESKKREDIKKILVDTFERYGFNPMETPVVEYEEFVKGENSQDEAVSDIFKLKDKGKRKLALRYEFTFQLKRIMKGKKLPFRRYQIGPVFRDEPVSANRFRQFTQCDCDIVGSTLKDDAEILVMAGEVLGQLGIQNIILMNNRKLLNEVLEKEGVKEKDKEKVLREIDKFDKIPEVEVKKNLKKFGCEKIIDNLKKGKEYFEKFESFKEVIEVIRICNDYGLEVRFAPTIIRGLSYYNGTVFEIKSKGIKETIVAGGSYMFEGTQCSGISFGLERLSILSEIKSDRDKYLIVSLDEDSKSIEVTKKLRNRGDVANIYYGKPSKALEYANSYNYNKVIFVGAKEVKEKKLKVKNMATGKEEDLVLKKVAKRNVLIEKQ